MRTTDLPNRISRGDTSAVSFQEQEAFLADWLGSGALGDQRLFFFDGRDATCTATCNGAALGGVDAGR